LNVNIIILTTKSIPKNQQQVSYNKRNTFNPEAIPRNPHKFQNNCIDRFGCIFIAIVSMNTSSARQTSADNKNAFLRNESFFICFLKLEQMLKARNPKPKKYCNENRNEKLLPKSSEGV
jgi:hypothetical protein